MFTIAIASIVLGIAIPSFSSTIASNRFTTQANELVTALNLARSEAIKRGVQVTVRRKGATSSQWESGWDVFVDVELTPVGNVIGTFTDDTDTTLCEVNAIGSPTEDCLLKTYSALPSGFTLRTGGSYTDWVAYLPSGLSTSTTNISNDTFRLCNGTNTATSRAIAINSVGRARVSTPAASCP